MLEVRDLACQRGEQPLFSGISFDVSAGELLWVEGRNGSGKTSLLRILCGLSPAEAGSIRWRGENIRGAREVLLGDTLFLAHANGLKDDLTVVENLRFDARLAGMNAGADRVDAALRACGLGERRDLAVRYLSQGQRRRAALARLWLAQSRKLWILDEPFAALDAESVDRLAAHLGAHLEAGGLAVLTTHQEVPLPAGRTRRLRLDH
ncbi:MAG: cytochrome c biogenesis heme-transporting ATPase CcmA [Burkholderiales bacterium]|nr:cytochrome c biogenesis heme-transporting ATPase CcmA [Burkholderiales bacterium]